MKEVSTEELIRRSRRARARARRISALRRWLPKLVVLAAVIGAAGWSALAGPLHARLTAGNATAVSSAAAPGTAATATTSTASTSTTIGLVGRDYSPGDCVVWDQDTAYAARRVTRVVPCSTPHLIEIIGHAGIPGGTMAPYPDDAQWTAMISRLCQPFVLPYLGYAIDPAGRFSVGGMRPLPDSWAALDRTLWCGVDARWPGGAPPPADRFSTFSGAVKGQDQTYLYGTGTCLGLTPTGQLGEGVPCAGPHGVEITGSALLAGTTLPTTDTAWEAAVGTSCSLTATRYAGARLPAAVRSGWLELAPSSWAAGRRVVECTLGRYDAAGHLTPSSGSVRTGA